MKYIRTKDGRIFATDNIRKALGCVVYYPIKGCGVGFEDSDIINQADTIKELCDRCVVIHKYGEQPKEMSFFEAQYFIDVWTRKVKSADPIIAIYGAIWTDKGLIYVAKMNDKGEMELL